MVVMTTWIDRYRAGEREEVWEDLRSLGTEVRTDAYRSDAQAVCDEMASRARTNIDLLIRRLRAEGFEFVSNDALNHLRTPFVAPTPDAPAFAAWLDESLGRIPLAVSSWIRIVGDVWLVGVHPDWEASRDADGLAVEFELARYGDPREFYAGEVDAWRDCIARGDEYGDFVLPFAPDRLTKANVSGGAPYGFILPDASAEGTVSVEDAGSVVEEPFVRYLNRCFSAGGFPGADDSPEAKAVRARLSQGMLPL